MSVYHQLGHDSVNLLREPGLSVYAGAVLSPVNYREAQTANQIALCAEQPPLETILDPQLYVPTSQMGKLRTWHYFPSDVDTADTSSITWWNGVTGKLATVVKRLKPSGVCSPAVIPRVFSDDYYATVVDVANRFAERLDGTNTTLLQTVIVRLEELAEPARPMAIASVISRSVALRCFLVLSSSVVPRRELKDVDGLKGAMRLIALLEEAGLRVLVGFSAGDMLLWKAAGATDCASGKFFNLRRFTRARFEEPEGGGGQLPYWFEEGLVAFLREADLDRLYKQNRLSAASLDNPFGRQIIEQRVARPADAWLGLSWRQFLWWFGDAEARIRSGSLQPRTCLKEAEAAWLALSDENFLMEEPRNDGAWLRPWRRALSEFRT